jgi:hypothetical protein
MTQPPPIPQGSSRNRNIVIVTVVIGLVVGLVSGIFVSVLFNLPSSFHTGVGVNNQVQVSGAVQGMTSGTLYFQNPNETILTSATVNNGHYSVLLVGGQSYNIYSDDPTTFEGLRGYAPSSDFHPFYVPLGVTTFTANF